MCKKLSTLALAITLLFSTGTNIARAELPTIDVAAITQSIKGYLVQLQGIQQQFEMLQNMAVNIEEADSTIKNLASGNIKQNFQQIMKIQKNTKYILADYSGMEEKFDEMYPTFWGYAKKTGADCAADANNTLDNTDKALKDSINAGGLVMQSWDDMDSLDRLMSTNSQGIVKAAQIGNRISAISAKGMSSLIQVVSANNAVQAAYIKQKNLEEAKKIAERERADQANKDAAQAMT
ncbi:MAG: hypothetical protein WC725_05320 [Patescibacteria group bacterium]|jgi:P-type conjugative transfer protein TrbJ